MLTNILLGLILGIVLSSYIIINKKVTQIQSNTEYILTKLRGIDGFNSNNNKLIEHLSGRFNAQMLMDNEHYDNVITLLKSRFKDVDNATDSICDRINNIDYNVQTLIVTEHRITRNEIKKLAKISSKKKLQSKTNKSINHKQKC